MNLTSILTGLRAEQRSAERRLQEVKKAINVLEGFTGSRFRRASKRKLSAAGRARIIAAQRKRWAKIRAAKKK